MGRNGEGLLEGYARWLVAPRTEITPRKGESIVWSSRIDVFLKQVSPQVCGHSPPQRVPQTKDKEWKVYLPHHTGTGVVNEQDRAHVLGLNPGKFKPVLHQSVPLCFWFAGFSLSSTSSPHQPSSFPPVSLL